MSRPESIAPVFIALGRPTFDLASAAPIVAAALRTLRRLRPRTVGTARIHLSIEEVGETLDSFEQQWDTVVVAFGTFTDTTLTAAIVDDLPPDVRIILWAFPEERTGGRLLRNSLCGANLAAFHLGRLGHRPHGLYQDPDADEAQGRLEDLLTSGEAAAPIRKDPEAPDAFSASDRDRAQSIVSALAHTRIGLIGEPPAGFDPCQIPRGPNQTGVSFETEPLDHLFIKAKSTMAPLTLPPAARDLAGIEDLDPHSTAQGLRLHRGIETLVREHKWDAVALRCWPECFTQFGGAPCGALSFLANDGVPAACEADGFGALTCLLLQMVAGEPAFLADLVDLRVEDNTAVFWHCGVAPGSMADPDRVPLAATHPNRNMPLTVEFGLRPGRITIARLSQSRNEMVLVLGYGSVISASLPFRGTSGVVSMDAPVDRIFDALIKEGLEHHFGLVYGDHRTLLRAVAAQWGIAVLELGSIGSGTPTPTAAA